MAKFLKNGGAGFIGSHVIEVFVSQGYDVVIADDLYTRRKSSLNRAAQFYKMEIDFKTVEMAI